MPLIKTTGKSKGFAFIVIPEKVPGSTKLDGIDLLGRKLLIKEAISIRKKDSKQNKRPNLVVNNFTDLYQNKIYSSDPELYLATSRMRQPSVSVKLTKHMKKRIIQDNHKERKFL